MTMTQLIGDLERSGWRFQSRDGHVAVRMPAPKPPDADLVLLELSRRNAEAVSFLKARADAERLRELLGLSEIPVFRQTPVPGAKLISFPGRIKSTRPAPLRHRS